MAVAGATTAGWKNQGEGWGFSLVIADSLASATAATVDGLYNLATRNTNTNNYCTAFNAISTDAVYVAGDVGTLNDGGIQAGPCNCPGGKTGYTDASCAATQDAVMDTASVAIVNDVKTLKAAMKPANSCADVDTGVGNTVTDCSGGTDATTCAAIADCEWVWDGVYDWAGTKTFCKFTSNLPLLVVSRSLLTDCL